MYAVIKGRSLTTGREVLLLALCNEMRCILLNSLEESEGVKRAVFISSDLNLIRVSNHLTVPFIFAGIDGI